MEVADVTTLHCLSVIKASRAYEWVRPNDRRDLYGPCTVTQDCFNERRKSHRAGLQPNYAHANLIIHVGINLSQKGKKILASRIRDAFVGRNSTFQQVRVLSASKVI